MIIYNGIAQAADAVRAYLIANPAALPEPAQAKLASHTGTGASPVDLVVTFAEAVYANREDLTAAHEDAFEIAAGAAVLAETFGFHGLNKDSRGSRMAILLDGGEVAEPPEARADLLPSPPAAEPPEPPMVPEQE